VYESLSNVYGSIIVDESGMPWLDYFYVPVELDAVDDYEYNTMLGELMGCVEVGVSDIDLVSERIEVDEILEDDFERCPICQETADELAARGLRKTICGHAFCDACLSQWLAKHKKCPICMQDLQDLCDAAAAAHAESSSKSANSIRLS
jgi:hypothetical protein